MIVPFPIGVEIPTTIKGSIMLAKVYEVFSKEIEDTYRSLDENFKGTMKLDLSGTENYFLKLGQQVLGPQLRALEDDLFTLGLDSLKAIQMRGSVMQDLDLDGKSKLLGYNIVMEQGNLANLARHVHGLASGESVVKTKPIVTMQDWISEFSVSPSARPLHTSRD